MASAEPKPEDAKPAEQPKPAEPKTTATALGEDDEFEDFPVDDATALASDADWRADWPEDQTEAAQGSGEAKHLWEESWDDDDTSDDFSAQLKEELKRVEASKRR
ncbi:26S proteasome complex subunit sem-1 [Tolypocladium capitatum]|uniref:26S proteasome complex subunit SEM1 n=1 Tax=Tolypocladium capitatum TaxID=45235 RepID=A0A2K3QN86_9HYPO|nr:26S proteasome complex subunit sem-1 [Tolypocladium capitatum]